MPTGSSANTSIAPKTLRRLLLLILPAALSLSLPVSLRPRSLDKPESQRAFFKSAKSPSQEAKLIFRVYNYAGLDSASLLRSEKVAAGIFEQVGIGVTWVDCPTSLRNAATYKACDSPMEAADLVLRILPRRMAIKLPRSDDALGSTQTCSAKQAGCYLNLFYYRIDDLGAKGYRPDRILAYAIVHEAAHALLGPSHSDEGIMRGDWTSYDLERISMSMQFDFTRDQSRQLRDAVLRRATPLPVPEGVTSAHLLAP